jgi:hypothetical protein
MGWMIRPCGVGGDGVAAGVVCGYWGGWGVVCGDHFKLCASTNTFQIRETASRNEISG